MNYNQIKQIDKFHLIINKDGIYRMWFTVLKRILFGECIYCGYKAPKFKWAHTEHKNCSVSK